MFEKMEVFTWEELESRTVIITTKEIFGELMVMATDTDTGETFLVDYCKIDKEF